MEDKKQLYILRKARLRFTDMSACTLITWYLLPSNLVTNFKGNPLHLAHIVMRADNFHG